MHGHKDPGTVAAEIRMSRTASEGAVLVLEGADDVRFWLPRRHEVSELVDAEGKTNVLGAIGRLAQPHLVGVLGIVDDDYDSLESRHHGSNVVTTDAHDLECVLCRSSALDAVVAEFGEHAKVRRFEEREGVDVRTGLLNRALPFGRVRWLAERHRESVENEQVRVRRFVDEPSWSVNEAELNRVADRDSPDGSALSGRAASLPSADPWHVTHGHDLIELLRIGLKHVLGDLQASTGTRDIARVLRVAIPDHELKATGFGERIREWESRNPPYAVFRV